MKHLATISAPRRTAQPLRRFVSSVLLGGMMVFAMPAVSGPTPLADKPLFSNKAVPGNVALALSVEFPTAVSVAHLEPIYKSSRTYLGYFDPNKCYDYKHENIEDANTASHFYSVGKARNHTCSGKWSGNFMNWATMQTIDAFRLALTGGYRRVDTPRETILERAWASGQGGTANFPNRSLTSDISGATPFGLSSFNMRIQGLGNKMRFTDTLGNLNVTGTAYRGQPMTPSSVYEVAMRVKVCDRPSHADEPASNCKPYRQASKPEGLMQQYAKRMRFSVFGYLSDSSSSQNNLLRDGGVLRAQQKFVGPKIIRPGYPEIDNLAQEWNPETGVFNTNPDGASVSLGTPISNSGAINYLNKFGEIIPNSRYKTFDPVGELYYAALRYLKNQGNVSTWTNVASGDDPVKLADGFPVITNWDDPIQRDPFRKDPDGKNKALWCQKHFILGIGDVNSWPDKNVPGDTPRQDEPPKPTEVRDDRTVDAFSYTNKVGVLQGLGPSLGTCCKSLISGLAYHANTHDIRPDVRNEDLPIGQTVQTYWLDVLEYSQYKQNNQYYLATKYGGFSVPEKYNADTNTTALPQELWSTTGDTVGIEGKPQQIRPDNYFVAARPDQVIDGLTKAFAKISSSLTYSTAFSMPNPQIGLSGNASFAAHYDASNWAGDVVASELSFDPSAEKPTLKEHWRFASKLAKQAAADKRNIVTWNGGGIPFVYDNLSGNQKKALDTSYRPGDDGELFLNYLRGKEANNFYRVRTSLVGDIVNSKVNPVGAPGFPFSDTLNPGYAAFVTEWAKRPTVVYVGTNGGMMHAIDGSLTGAAAGNELFAYVPGALYEGPTGTPDVNGLAALADPSYEHRFYVDATPVAYDIDFNNTDRAPNPKKPDWRTVLIGGLGKGGKSYYAIDVTNPVGMKNEGIVASKVLWEFTHPDLGYTYGDPAVVKTLKYGWVAILPSGYNNANGQGYFFIINPRNGALIDQIRTGAGTPDNPAGLAQVNTFVNNRADGTADAAYAGDLLGNLWRLDLTDDPGKAEALTKLALLTDANGIPQPVTTRPRIEIQRNTYKRTVLIGTGRLLSESDFTDGQEQSLYAIADGTLKHFIKEANLPSGIRFPIKRGNMRLNANPIAGVESTPQQPMGWYVDLDRENGVGWRVLLEPTPFYGIVAFSAMLPGDDACKPGGKSRIYAIDFGTGKTVLNNADGTLTNYLSIPARVTEMAIVSKDGKPTLIVGDDAGGVQTPQFTTPSPGLRHLNWRELPRID